MYSLHDLQSHLGMDTPRSERVTTQVKALWAANHDPHFIMENDAAIWVCPRCDLREPVAP